MLNKQGPTGINWTDATWNPITGCLHGCDYCYARALYHRRGWSFEPTFHPERLGDAAKEKTPHKIFVCSVADFFGRWVPFEWKSQVRLAVARAPQHIYQFLTKAPGRLSSFDHWPSNCWAGATATNQAMADAALRGLAECDAQVKFLSCEPLQGPIEADLSGIQWLIIGAQTGKGARQPEVPWVTGLTDAADKAGVAVLYKDNLIWEPRRVEFPIARPTAGPTQAPLFAPALQPA